jgi:hypothetical protein
MYKRGLLNIFDNNNLVLLLLSIPLSLFLLIGYFREDLINITMPIFLYYYGILFNLVGIHAIRRGAWMFFDRGTVFLGKNPIQFWILVVTNFIVANMLLLVSTIYLFDIY